VNAKQLFDVMALREAGDLDGALFVARGIVGRNPDDPQAHYQLASTLDTIGNEREAVDAYESALSLGLVEPEREGALLGLGSTLRALGRYVDAERILGEAVEAYPLNAAFRVYRALNDFNRGEYHDATRTLLRELVRTTNDQTISLYTRALNLYAEDLDRRW